MSNRKQYAKRVNKERQKVSRTYYIARGGIRL